MKNEEIEILNKYKNKIFIGTPILVLACAIIIIGGLLYSGTTRCDNLNGSTEIVVFEELYGIPIDIGIACTTTEIEYEQVIMPLVGKTMGASAL